MPEYAPPNGSDYYRLQFEAQDRREAAMIRYAYWRHKASSMVYAVKLAERDGVRVVVGAVGPLNLVDVPVLQPDWISAWENRMRMEPWLARVLDDRQDEYEEVTL